MKKDDLTKLQQQVFDLVLLQSMTFQGAANQLGVELNDVRKADSEIRTGMRDLIKVRDLWKRKKIGGDFWSFSGWYDSQPHQCIYCGISEAELQLLHDHKLIENKRIFRGKTLEIERRKANEAYNNLGNLSFACYWCNNAKTDTFSEDEFKAIGKAIGEVWRKRLNQIKR
ncbi:hypothetical protein [Candidatus Pollutiaquabacter sp.]|uniref:hypothetical protein n=1 Tax=Candidatus Pollutiaquabacter sp. TaxID=3416354 RepID=UPI003C9A316E|nr:hypothetical protein [Bacteroidota bacterium]